MENGHEYKKGFWNTEEDRVLMKYVKEHGIGKWNRIAKVTGLKRCGKSCRLRWKNYLSPNVKRGDFSVEEDDLIIRLHNLLGNRWSLIAGRVPGRTDNQVKNYWNTHLSKKLGVKKAKTNVSASPGTFSNEAKEITSNSPSKPKGSSHCNDEGESEKFVEARSLNARQEMLTDDRDFESNFWFANGGHSLYPSSLTEPYHDYFVDLDWAAL